MTIFGLGVFITTDAMAQRGRSGGGWGQATNYDRNYNSQTVETISGEVVSVDKMTPLKGMHPGVHAVVKTDEEDPRHPRHDARYNDLSREEIPAAECLKDTLLRVLPCWHDLIVPAVRSGKRVVITAHGNSLRALVKYLDDMSDAEIVDLNIPTGIPLVYDLSLSGDLKPIRHYYLGEI